MGVWPCSQHICFRFLSLLWWHQDCISASCLQCCPAGLIGLWPHGHAGKYLVAVMGQYMIQLKTHRVSWSRRIFIIGIGVTISHKVLWWFPDLFWIATRGSLHPSNNSEVLILSLWLRAQLALCVPHKNVKLNHVDSWLFVNHNSFCKDNRDKTFSYHPMTALNTVHLSAF